MFKLPPLAAKGNYLYEANPWQEVVQMTLENYETDGRTISLRGGQALHFGNVSYLGLDTDERLKEAAIEAIRRYGVQFSSSRSFLQLPLYAEFEFLLEKMFDRPVVVAPSTTLAHQAAMPLFIHPEDAVIIDYQAHASLQMVLEIVRAKGTHIEYIPHNDLQRLEDKLKMLCPGRERVWLVADGVYSMYGDAAPLSVFEGFQKKYDNLHLYLDDAHGMSWTGRNGRGYVCENFELNDRTLLVTSLNKGFAAGGGAIVCPNPEVKTWLMRCGSSLIFSGPVNPAALGAGIASAKIHLSPEIETRQRKVLDNIRHFRELTDRHNIRVADRSETPIFFVAMGKWTSGVKLCRMLREAGFYTNLGVYPAVPFNQTGLRVSVHHHLEKADIEDMVRVLAEMIPMILLSEKTSPERVGAAFSRVAGHSV